MTIKSKRLWLQLAITLAVVLLVSQALSTYLWSQAEPFMPPKGYVFPREPVLVGEYEHYVVLGRDIWTGVGGVRVCCASFSYYSATWFDPYSYFDCERKTELQGKQVEIHRVRIPEKRTDLPPLVVKIVSLSEGRKVYLDLSDAQIRDKWIRHTRRSGRFDKGSFILFGIVAFFAFVFSRKLSTKLIKGDDV